MAKVAIYLLCIILMGKGTSAQDKGNAVQWAPAEELAKYAFKLSDKPILLDVYTDWCHYCKLMDATTWRHNELAAYVNEYFYPVKLNAETKDSLRWNGKVFAYVPRYKVHMLAAELLKGNMVYPSTVIIAPNGDIQVLRGALKAAELQLALTYYGSGNYRHQDFEQYMRSFSRTWR